MKGALLVAGTTSDAGKSLVVTGMCRSLARRGISVAPFKAQNMSNNSVVTEEGGEIGRAQALQAFACGLQPSVAFNPVLLKPGSDRRSQVVIRGEVVGDASARDYVQWRQELTRVVEEDLSALRARFDVVICEGAGSPAEINLRATDLANMGLAQSADLPVVLVSDIDRGGSLAHLFGTLGVLGPQDQQRIRAFIINKFRGERSLLAPGIDMLTEMTGRPTIGVIPFAHDLWIDAEDSLSTRRRVGATDLGTDTDIDCDGAQSTHREVYIAAVRLPRASNTTDVEALACEPGVAVEWVTHPADLARADAIVIPGTKSTIDDLAWLRARGFAGAIASASVPVFGICGGFQMLCRTISDTVESRAGEVAGLGVFPLDIRFDRLKTLGVVNGIAMGFDVTGYEIHHGRLVQDAQRSVPLHQRGWYFGTHWHGMFENDAFRRSWLRLVAGNRRKVLPQSSVSFAGERLRQVDLIADLIDEHVDCYQLSTIITAGERRHLPILHSHLEPQ